MIGGTKLTKAFIDPAVCKGCGLCVQTCPKKVIALDRSVLNSKGYYPARVADIGGCIGCAMCALMCPDCAITVKEK